MTKHIKLETLMQEAETMIRTAASEAKRLGGIGSHKLRISTLIGEIRDYQSEIGAWVCDHRDVLPEDADVQPLFAKIDSLMDEVEEHRRAVEELMRGHAANQQGEQPQQVIDTPEENEGEELA